MKKSRDPRWDEEFQFMLDEPPTDDRLHVEVVSTSKRMGLLHPKVIKNTTFFFIHIMHLITNSLVTCDFLCYIFFLMFLLSFQESLGYVDIYLSDVVNNKRINEKYHLIDSKNGRIQIEMEWRTSS